MSRQWLSPPRVPTARAEHEGRPYLLWLPDSAPPWPAMVIVHGAGSRKENHADFARACASAGWAALAYDVRGHGDSRDELTPAAFGDVDRMARLLAGIEGVDAERVCVRGSSMGGHAAIHAAGSSAAVAGAIAICPAGERELQRGLRRRTLEVRAGPRARADLTAWLSQHDLRESVAAMGAKPLLLIHARGDERIPFAWSQELHARKAEPRKLILLDGGSHRSAQHDAELQGVALRWLRRALVA